MRSAATAIKRGRQARDESQLTYHVTSLRKWATVVGILVLLLASVRGAAANCQNGSTVQSVVAGNNLSAIISGSFFPGVATTCGALTRVRRSSHTCAGRIVLPS